MSPATVTEDRDLEFRIELERRIDAPIDVVFETLVEHMGPDFVTPEEGDLSLELEPWPGGRWYRNLGGDDGHLWGHVQAIRRPDLLEIAGPLFMSHAVANNVQYRLEETDGTTTLRFVHEAFGLIPDEARDSVSEGWNDQLDRIAAYLG